MKYNINLNQQMMIKYNLNVTQWCILDVISVAPMWCEAVVYNNETYYWIARQKIAEELAALDLKPDTIYRALKVLADLGFLNHEKQGKKDLIYLTDLGKKLFVTMSEKNPSYYVGKKSEKNSEKNPTYNNTSINNKTNKSEFDNFIASLKKEAYIKSKVTKTKDGEIAFKNIEDKQKLFNDYLEHQKKEKNFAKRITAFMEDYDFYIKENTDTKKENDDWNGWK